MVGFLTVFDLLDGLLRRVVRDSLTEFEMESDNALILGKGCEGLELLTALRERSSKHFAMSLKLSLLALMQDMVL